MAFLAPGIIAQSAMFISILHGIQIKFGIVDAGSIATTHGDAGTA